MGNRPGNISNKSKPRKTDKRSLSKCSLERGSSSTSNSILTNLETFTLVWLDPNIDTSKENIKTQTHLREILTCLITFNDVKLCENWLKKCYHGEKIILIVSGVYGQEIVPKIHPLQTIITIYVYCLDVDRNKIWAKNFSKIRSVVSSTNDLLQQLSQNQTHLESVEDSKALKIYKHQQDVHSLDTKTASFIWYQLLLEILLSPNYIPSNGTFDELIQILQQYSSDDEYGRNLISEFEQTYKSKRAVRWLTRDTPLARFVNKVLREQNINMIFALRFLLVDIHTQLIEHQAQSLNVFKFQPMLKSEMEDLRANPGRSIMFNGFLYASTNMPQLMSTLTNNDQSELVLFDIHANYRSGVAPFAFVRNIDSNIEEQIEREILFMCGSIFEVGPLICQNSIWKLQLTLTGTNDSPVLFNMKQQLQEDQNLCIIADLLKQCNQVDKAIIYYQKLLDELPKQHPLVSQIQKQLSETAKVNSASLPDVQFILLNLSERLNPFASGILDFLCSLTSKIVFIVNDESTIDLSQWSTKRTFVFTTAQVAGSFKNLPKEIRVFTLETDKDNVDQRQRFGSINDLIGQLADEIIQMYRFEANEYTRANDLHKAKEQDDRANRIYHELRKIHDKRATNKIAVKTSDSPAPVLIWLLSNSGNDEEDTTYIEKTFGDFFSSYLTFYHKSEYHLHLTQLENLNDVFAIIHINHQESVVECSRQFSNVKYVYIYGESTTVDEEIITNLDDLCYYLTSNLIEYYGKLGDQYRLTNQSKKARNMFLQAQNLCHLLSTNSFLKK